MFIYDHNSFCNKLAEKISEIVLEMSQDIVSEFLKKTELISKIVEAEEKKNKKGGQSEYKEFMANCLNLISNKLEDLFEKNRKLSDEILKGACGRGWNPMIRALRRLQRKLKQSEIPVDKSQPRGRLVVADEEGFPTDNTSSTKSPQTGTRLSKSEESKSKTKTINLDSITDEELLKMDINLDLNDLGSDENLDDLLAEEENPKQGEDVLSAIEAILDGGFDTVVLDKGRLQTLKMDDLKG